MKRTSAGSLRMKAMTMATAVLAATVLSGCYSSTAADRAPFSEVTAEPSAVKMPKMSSPDLPEQQAPSRQNQQPSDDPCAIDDITLAACLDGATALVGFGPNQALVATGGADVFLVSPGKTPQFITNTGVAVKQFLASPTVTEDGQVFILREDNTIARLTIVTTGGVQSDLKEMPELAEPGIEGIFYGGGQQVNKLISGDANIDFHQFCHIPPGSPELITVTIEGVPQLAQLSAGIVKPLGGVDLDNSIGGCAIAAGKAAIAIPNAEKVVVVDLRLHRSPASGWEVTGTPETIADGQFGHITHLAAVEGAQGVEIWAATTNRDFGAGGVSDERVIRLPQGGAAGGSPA